jgi:DNA helicase-2/ATP-dependent DNA helicase PcrA
MIGEKETIIGVIGDVGQSIFAFQGAKVEKFIEFNLNNCQSYKIENNYRSTEEIIDVLNHVRNESDFLQKSPDNKKGNFPQILIGRYFDSYKESINISRDEHICTLSYKNDIANIMKWGYEDYFNSEDINEPLFRDGNRGWLITFTITAIEYSFQNKIKDALKYMEKAYRKIENFDEKKALENLKRLRDNYNNYKDGSIREFYNNYIYGNYGVQQRITRGPTSDYYESREYKKIAVTVRINDDDSLHRTIHKSKGDQFKSVLLIIPPEENLEFLLNPDITREKNRLYYVALSRAKKNLFINISQLSEDKITQIKGIGFDVVKLDNN